MSPVMAGFKPALAGSVLAEPGESADDGTDADPGAVPVAALPPPLADW
jgi:hypothetical protein